MNEIDFSTSACRHCRFYKSEGRRGGSCQMLGVPVQSSWKACNLASSPFDNTLKKLEDIFQLDTPTEIESSHTISSQVAKVEIDKNLQTTLSRKLE